MSRETDLKKWRDVLSDYYADESIRKYYHKYDGSYTGLLHLHDRKVCRNKTIKGRINFRKTSSIVWLIYGDETGYLKSRRAWKSKKKKTKGVITIHLEEASFNTFFDEKVHEYFTDKKISEKNFNTLEIILKDYYDEYNQMKQLEKHIKQDSIKKREEKIKEILKQANSILRILNSDLQDELPTEVKIKTIGELNKTTEEKLKELNLVPTYSYSHLFQAIRKI